MKQFNKIYEENKELDALFYNVCEINEERIEKDILALLVEIGELANETRCFKYWSDKKPSDKDDILDEFADCMLSTFALCIMVDIDLDEEFKEIKIDNIIEQFKELYCITSKLNSSLDRDTLKLILSNLVNLARLLNFSDEEIIKGCLKKIERNKERFKTGF